MSLAYDRAGSGQGLLLVHGLGGERHVWEPVWPALTAQRDVVRVDLPGFGGSPALTDEPSPQALARAVAAFLEELEGFERPHVVGNSLGGWVGLELARLGVVSSVTGVCAAGFWKRTWGPRPTGQRAAMVALRPIVGPGLRIPGLKRRALGGVVAHPERVPHADAVRLVDSYLTSAAFLDVANAMRARRIEDGTGIDVPVTLVWADQDGLVGQPTDLPLTPDRVELLPDAGHVPLWDAPDAITALILRESAR